MGKRNWIAAAVLAAAGVTLGTAATAGTSIGVQIGLPAPVYVAPPPPVRYEYVPASRPGYFWVAGHWEWQGNGHVWVPGHYVRERVGYYYTQPVWYREGDRWAYRGGGWARRDMDRDGIPNRYDRDRDGDGVPNRYDRAPNNPYRR